MSSAFPRPRFLAIPPPQAVPLSAHRTRPSAHLQAASMAADPAMDGAPLPAPAVSRALPIPHGMIHAPGSPLEDTLRLAAAAAKRDCPVFVRGESGSGKEMLAQYLHAGGPRARGPFVAVNCAALAPGLIESELFGHRKGAFTGAVADNAGRFRQADGGTLFLDEIGDMPLEVQTRLLRALQEKRVSPVGDAREYPVDFRLVCATHRDLRAAVAEGRFREDLFYRLNVLEVPLPPLRERPGDIRALMGHFLSGLLPPDEAERAMETFPPRLITLPYPGNIRELRNLAERFCVLREMGGGWSEAVTQMLPEAPGKRPIPGASADAAPDTSADAADAPARSRIRNSRVSDDEIFHALDVCGHHRGRASGLLGISRRALQYRLAKMGVNNNVSPAI